MTAIDRAADVLSMHGCLNSRTSVLAARSLAAAGLLVTDEYAAEHERFRQHSIALNSVAWALSDMLGDIPEGAEQHEGPTDPMVLVDRIRALLVTDEIQAILSMLVHWRRGDRGPFTLDIVAPIFIDAYLASRGET